MALDIDKILAGLQNEKTAEELFFDNLKDGEAIQSIPVLQLEKTAEYEEDLYEQVTDISDMEKVAEMEKVAAELDAQGRILARAFVSELQKLADEGNF